MAASDSDQPNEPIGLDQAYSAKSPAENRDLYESWAPSYESGFVEYMGYVYHRTVADLFAAHRGSRTGAVLDVGCGTGVVGAELRCLNIAPVDGVDISPAMLEQAATKTAPDSSPAFRSLIPADLTAPLAIDSGTYAGIISAGTFTHGHVGPDALDELLRISTEDALFTIGINAEHYATNGFQAKLDSLVQDGSITQPDLIDVAIYEGSGGEHDADRALVAIFNRIPDDTSATSPQ